LRRFAAGTIENMFLKLSKKEIHKKFNSKRNYVSVRTDSTDNVDIVRLNTFT